MRKDIEYRAIYCDEIRVDDKTKKIMGYAAVFNRLSVDLGGFREKVAPGAFSETLKTDDIRALFNHDTSKVLGRNVAGTLVLREDDTGLFVEVDPPNTSVANDLRESINRRDITGMSFGFDTIEDEWNMVDGEEIRTLKKIKLWETSPATFPAYTDTTLAVRSLDKVKKLETEKKNTNYMAMRLRLTGADVRPSKVEPQTQE